MSLPAIRLIAIDDALRRAVEGSDDDFVRAHGASLGAHRAVALSVIAQTLAFHAEVPRAPEWGGFLVADEVQPVVVGTCGYKHGPVADGTVEIAYFTFPEFERRGYGTAMARELTRRALISPDVREVVAHTLPEPNASTRILERVDFTFAGDVHDPEDGRVWRWVLERHG